MDKLVSVIVPVYNSEKYLRECIDSIVSQTYQNLEIILVDDGSTDASGTICDEFALRDGRVKVIHKENEGNGDARNTGLKCATGEWIIWVDSDDVIHERHVELLYKVAISNNADMVVGYYKVIGDKELVSDNEICDDYMNNVIKIDDLFWYDDKFIERYSMIMNVPWGKLCRKEIFDGIAYPSVNRHVDTWTTWKTYEKAQNVLFLNMQLYYWRNNPDSITRNFDEAHLQGIGAYAERMEYYVKNGKQRLAEICFAEYLDMFFWCYNRMRECGIELNALMPYYNCIRKNVKCIKLSKSMGLKQWVKYRYVVYYKIPKIISAKRCYISNDR